MKNFITIVLMLSSFFLKAQYANEPQPEILDSAYTIPLFTVSYAKQWTSGDMNNRFGANNNIGGSFAIKTKTNWYFGIKGSFIWGADVKQNNILDGIAARFPAYDDNGNYDGEQILTINANGNVSEIFLDQRGSSFFAIGGRLFNKFAPNKNSGILAYGGIGTLHHKISIKFQDGDLPQLNDQLKEGYDRMSLGFAVNGFVGYLFMSKNRLLNFYAGFDYTQGWTKSLRKYNYDTQAPDNKVNTDILYGFRIGWILRLNKRSTQEFYYN